MNDAYWIGWIAIGFASGSIPFGVLLAKAKGVDLRTVGSGNTGATNVGRALGRSWGAACFLLDAAKGAVPVLVSGVLMGVLGQGIGTEVTVADWGWVAVAIAAILGHVFSPFLSFKGGKGVATACGALLALYPVMTFAVLIAGLLFVVVLLATGFMSVASMVAAVSLPITAGLFGAAELSMGGGNPSALLPGICTGALIAATVVWRHRSNLQRVRAGTEPRVLGRGRMRPKSSTPAGDEPSNPKTTSINHH